MVLVAYKAYELLPPIRACCFRDFFGSAIARGLLDAVVRFIWVNDRNTIIAIDFLVDIISVMDVILLFWCV